MTMMILLAACGGHIDSANDASGDATSPGEAGADATSVDGAADVSAFFWPDAALAEACRDAGWIIHVDTDGGFAIDASSAEITGTVGTWSCAVSGDWSLELRAEHGDASWQVVASSDWQNGKWLEAGTYTSSGSDQLGSWMQIEVAGHGCTVVPTGTFTIHELATGLGDPAPASKMLMTFDLHCNGQGSLTGCARFGN